MVPAARVSNTREPDLFGPASALQSSHGQVAPGKMTELVYFTLDDDGRFYSPYSSIEGALIGGMLNGDMFTDAGTTAWNGWFASHRIGRKTTWWKQDIKRWTEIAADCGASVNPETMEITMPRSDLAIDCDILDFTRALVLIDAYNDATVK